MVAKLLSVRRGALIVTKTVIIGKFLCYIRNKTHVMCCHWKMINLSIVNMQQGEWPKVCAHMNHHSHIRFPPNLLSQAYSSMECLCIV